MLKSISLARVSSVVLTGLLMLAAGCPPPPTMMPLEPLALDQAIETVNENTARISTGLKATGSVRGRFPDDQGQTRSFDLHGKMLLIPPHHLRFDVQNALGRSEFLLGSNADFFWAHAERDEDTFRFGRHATPENERETDLPIRPDWMIEALGLNSLPESTTGINGPVQLIESDYQRLLFISYDFDGQGMIRKSYWLSRYPPRLVERVVFHDEIGNELLRSCLSDYRRSDATSPLLPHRIRVDWPMSKAWIEFSVRRWQQRGELTTNHRAFQLPTVESLVTRYNRVVDIDSGEVLKPLQTDEPP
ncbi:MAG: hypothetical protein KAV82_13210 [Phycisphaerae bacterium]|nr:hypothetical protein [Phycisphaerae bacterium]